MNTAQFNAMLHAARELLRIYHAGCEFDPHTVAWAQTLVAANPRDKCRPRPKTNALLEVLVDAGSAGILAADIRAQTGMLKGPQQKLLNKLLRCGKAFALYGAQNFGRYFATAADRDAAQKAKPARQTVAPAAERMAAAGVVAKSAAVPKTAQKPKKEPKLKIPRLANTQPPRPSRARDAMTPARQAFNGVDQEPHAPMAAKAPKMKNYTNTAFNPDVKKPAKGKISREEWQSLTAANPHNVQPQIGPGLSYDYRYQLPPDASVYGAGFQAVGIGRSPVDGKAWGQP